MFNTRIRQITQAEANKGICEQHPEGKSFIRKEKITRTNIFGRL